MDWRDYGDESGQQQDQYCSNHSEEALDRKTQQNRDHETARSHNVNDRLDDAHHALNSLSLGLIRINLWKLSNQTSGILLLGQLEFSEGLLGSKYELMEEFDSKFIVEDSRRDLFGLKKLKFEMEGRRKNLFE